MKNFSHFLLILLFLSGRISLSPAQEKGKETNKQQLFVDTLDHAFDLSYYLYNLHGFLPVIAPITGPAVGYGAYGLVQQAVFRIKDSPFMVGGSAWLR